MGSVNDVSRTIEIYSIEGLIQFADFLKKYRKSSDLIGIEILDLEGLTHGLPAYQKAKAVELISYILKNDPYIEELLMVNNQLSKEILEELSTKASHAPSANQ
ncbi:MAG: hypothetical protein P4M12_12080 [Gammaproteobacteria bacterium]|nr:hypothetical protein [Gammaproteobacteria bacterium]